MLLTKKLWVKTRGTVPLSKVQENQKLVKFTVDVLIVIIVSAMLMTKRTCNFRKVLNVNFFFASLFAKS